MTYGDKAPGQISIACSFMIRAALHIDPFYSILHLPLLHYGIADRQLTVKVPVSLLNTLHRVENNT
jgi:hypothetical protein